MRHVFKSYRHALLSSSLLLSLLPVSATAAETIIVSATRTAQPLSKTGLSVSIIDKEELELRQSVSLAEALMLTPGSGIVRNGPIGQNATLSLRGAEAGHTVTLIDGVRLNDASSTDGQALLGDVLINAIERIEVLRGPQSTLYGSDAIGGVVNMQTIRGGEGVFSSKLTAEGGSFGTYRLNGAAAGTIGIVDYGLGANWFGTDGVSAAAEGRGNSERDGYNNLGLTGNMRVHVSQEASIDLRAYYTKSRADMDGYPPPFYAFGDTPEYARNMLLAGYVGFNLNLFDGGLQNRLALVSSRAHRQMFGIFDFMPPYTMSPAENFYAKGSSVKVEYQGIVDIDPDNQLTFGAESNRNTFSTMGQYDFAPTFGARRTTSGYLQYQSTLFDQLTLTGGLRYDRDSAFGDHTSLKAAAAWQIPDSGTVVRANYGDAFKAPSLYQLYSQYSNPSEMLSPETARGWEIGIDQSLLDDRLRASFVWFARKTSNQIGFFDCYSDPHLNCAVRPSGFYYNINRSKAEGAEIILTADLMDTLTASVNLTAMTAIDRTLRKDLARRPHIKAGGSLFWTPAEDVSLGLTVNHVGARFDGAGEVRPQESHTLVDLYGRYKVNETFSFFGRIENVFDKDYEPVTFYGAAGRTAMFGLTASL